MSTPTPPIARRDPYRRTVHGVELLDDYRWMHDRGSDEVMEYLRAENAYTAAMTAHLGDLRADLFEEAKARIVEDDRTAPYREGAHLYYSRIQAGWQYWIHCRRSIAPGSPEEILLDANEMAVGHDYFQIGATSVSPDGRLLAYTVDTTGGERMSLLIKDLVTGADIPTGIENASYDLAWANDGSTLFYAVLDDAMRPYEIRRHVVGADPDDVVVWSEPDEEYVAFVGDSISRRFIYVGSASSVTSEWWVLDADAPTAEPRCIGRRSAGIEYDVVDQGDRFLIRTNQDAPNFRLLSAPFDRPEERTELIAARDDVNLTRVLGFSDHVVLSERIEGVETLRVMRADGNNLSEGHPIQMPEDVYEALPFINRTYETDVLRFRYTSLVTPATDVDYGMDERTWSEVKRAEVPGYDPASFESARIWATAPDGTRVPITYVKRRDVAADGSAPGVLRGYGSYGNSEFVGFNPTRLSLLERGVVFAIAHVRGGGDLGESWRDDGKLMRKMNTFTDFIACAEHLIDAKLVARDRLAITGGSAGGLLMGAVVNMRPDLFACVVSLVPFVDVVNTMLDPSLPLTVGEYPEWGNPGEPEAFEYIRSYSPYDNIEAKVYPAMLVRSGINDPRVQYWEPAKYVAKLRAAKVDDRPLLLHMELEQGHGGASGRYDALREIAFDQAFMLDRLGVTGPVA